MTSDFAAFDYHFHGSTGALFGYGIVLGAIGMLGLALVLTGAWRVTRRGAAARRELRQSRREMAAVRRDLAASTPGERRQTEPKATHEPAWRRLFGKPATAPAGDAPRSGSTRSVQASTSK
ncbi:hypothetical protein OHB12_31040 [Nocardia sp. NBC_01730]|uniref:hypothetical protein n=1 Tax=Nocardia sp. NBC_01730 TaxID=2975998 RepID=UPI002E163496|nr:hypothetical protein OHB12_31040 [Nocardia sp. NBC_01730]